MKKKFPKKIYVKWTELEGEKHPFLTAVEQPEDLADSANESIEVGVFELKESGTLDTQPTFWLKGLPGKKR